VIPIRTPPLRERLEDVPTLVDYFLRRYALANNYRLKTFAPEALAFLQGLPWKGNVRELKNLVERLLILSPGDTVTRQDLVTIGGGAQPGLSEALLSVQTLRDFQALSEKLFILQKLEENAWNVTKTAESIDTPRSNLYKKIEQYEIKRQGESDVE